MFGYQEGHRKKIKKGQGHSHEKTATKTERKTELSGGADNVSGIESKRIQLARKGRKPTRDSARRGIVFRKANRPGAELNTKTAQTQS